MLSLLDMPRPFAKLKALDIDTVAQQVIECVLFLKNVSSSCRMCSLTIDTVAKQVINQTLNPT